MQGFAFDRVDFTFKLDMDSDCAEMQCCDEWGCAVLEARDEFGNTYGVEYNFCRECDDPLSALAGGDISAFYPFIECDTETSMWCGYVIDFDDEDWRYQLMLAAMDAFRRMHRFFVEGVQMC